MGLDFGERQRIAIERVEAEFKVDVAHGAKRSDRLLARLSRKEITSEEFNRQAKRIANTEAILRHYAAAEIKAIKAGAARFLLPDDE